MYRSIRNHRPCGPNRVYELAGPLLFCCRDMADWWDILIGFGVKGHHRTSSREVNLFTNVIPQTNGNLVTGITEVRNCPWCGEPITVCRVSRRRVDGLVVPFAECTHERKQKGQNREAHPGLKW